MTHRIPRILISAVQSGSGKTTIALGIVAALRRRGMTVQTFKVGPDYLDPTWLATASERPCYNLDGWMSDRDYVMRLFDRVTQDADIAVIEGVMGLFDGAHAAGLSGSSAEIAQWLDVPVFLIVSVSGMGQSIAPLAAGFADFESGVNVRGIIANRCGSETHRNILHEALAVLGKMPLIGAVPRNGFPELESRHLGLTTALYAGDSSTAVMAAFAKAAETHIDLNRTLQIARSATPCPAILSGTTAQKIPEMDLLRLAVARDAAFHFYYQDFFDEWEMRGGQTLFFSPLRDSSLPEGIDALYLGGGYPEMFAEVLSNNEGMRVSIRQFIHSGRPVYAECGGLIYLSEAITLLDGQRHRLLGVLPVETRMRKRRKRLGYIEVSLKEKTLWGIPGDVLRGHEFHYGELMSDPTLQEDWRAVFTLKATKTGRETSEGFSRRDSRILASFAHLHLASRPAAVDQFVVVCREVKSTNGDNTHE